MPHHKGMYAVTAVAAVLIPLGHGVGFGGWTARAAALLLMAALFLYRAITGSLTVTPPKYCTSQP